MSGSDSKAALTGIDLKIGLGVAWSKDDPTAARDDIIDIARTRSGDCEEVDGVGGSSECQPSDRGLPQI
jgi:hypothetical protein